MRIPLFSPFFLLGTFDTKKGTKRTQSSVLWDTADIFIWHQCYKYIFIILSVSVKALLELTESMIMYKVSFGSG